MSKKNVMNAILNFKFTKERERKREKGNRREDIFSRSHKIFYFVQETACKIEIFSTIAIAVTG